MSELWRRRGLPNILVRAYHNKKKAPGKPEGSDEIQEVTHGGIPPAESCSAVVESVKTAKEPVTELTDWQSCHTAEEILEIADEPEAKRRAFGTPEESNGIQEVTNGGIPPAESCNAETESVETAKEPVTELADGQSYHMGEEILKIADEPEAKRRAFGTPEESNGIQEVSNGGIPPAESCTATAEKVETAKEPVKESADGQSYHKAEEILEIDREPEAKVLSQKELVPVDSQILEALLFPTFKCIYYNCTFRCTSYIEMDNHFKGKPVVTYHGKVGRYCPVCRTYFLTQDDYRRHMINTHCVVYKCIPCRLLLPNERIAAHFRSVPHNCKIMKSELCDLVSINFLSVQMHRYLHCYKNEIACHSCSWVKSNHELKSVFNFVDHTSATRAAGRALTFKCKWCDFTTFSYSILDNHMNAEREHLDACPACSTEVKNRFWLVNSHFPNCENLNRVLRDNSLFNQLNKLKTVDATLVANATPVSCKSKRFENLMAELLPLPQEMAVEIVTPDKKTCRNCKQSILDDADVLVHFAIHFSPCCKICSALPQNEYCYNHGKWQPLSAKYFDSFTQHTFNLSSGGVMQCKYCLLTIRPKLSMQQIMSNVFRCTKCSFFSLQEFSIHGVKHELWRKCKSCDFSTHSDEDFARHAGLKACTCTVLVHDLDTHKMHCEDVLQDIVKKLQRNSSLTQQRKLASICTFFDSIQCKLCGLKLHSQETFTDHTHHHEVYMCHLCSRFFLDICSHYKQVHPNFKASLTELQDLSSYVKRYSYLFQTLERSIMLRDFFYNNFCTFCGIYAILPPEFGQHWQLHMTPCCKSCTELKRKCDTHSKLMYFLPAFYLRRFSQHQFRLMSEYKYTCVKCVFSIDRSTGGELLSRFARCPLCQVYLLFKVMAAHVMKHYALRLCNEVLCTNRVHRPKKWNAHIASEHRDCLKCTICSAAFASVSELLTHAAACEGAALDTLLNSPETEYSTATVSKLLSRGQCPKCFLLHETLVEQEPVFHPNFICPLCYCSLHTLHFKDHFWSNHKAFVLKIICLLRTVSSPRKVILEMKKLWVQYLDKTFANTSMGRTCTESASESDNTGNAVKNKCKQYEVTVEEYEHNVFLTFHEK